MYKPTTENNCDMCSADRRPEESKPESPKYHERERRENMASYNDNVSSLDLCERSTKERNQQLAKVWRRCLVWLIRIREKLDILRFLEFVVSQFVDNNVSPRILLGFQRNFVVVTLKLRISSSNGYFFIAFLLLGTFSLLRWKIRVFAKYGQQYF